MGIYKIEINGKEYSDETKLALTERMIFDLIVMVSSKDTNREIIELPFESPLNWLLELIVKTLKENKTIKENE